MKGQDFGGLNAPALFPKLFRRVVKFHADKGLQTHGTLKHYLETQKEQDRVFKTDEFLEQDISVAPNPSSKTSLASPEPTLLV